MFKNEILKLNGEKTLITGATGGIGKEIVKVFSRYNQKITALGRSIEKLNELNDMCLETKSIDINNESEIKNYVKNIEKIDNLILCHGIIGARPMRMVGKSFLNEVIQNNLISTIDFVSNLLRSNKINKPGRIIFISSVSAHMGANNTVPYAASKAGAEIAFKGLARDLLKKDITVNSICPAAIDTPLWEGNIGNAVNNIEDYPLGLGEVEDVANACVFLCLNGSKFITGESIILDGGAVKIN